MARNLAEPWLTTQAPDRVGAEPFFRRASELVQKGCDAGDREACSRLRSYVLYGSGAPAGIGVAKDLQRGLELTRKACTAGDPEACGEWAAINHRRYVRGERSDVTEPEVRASYLKACDAGLLPYCESAAAMLKKGLGGAADTKAALRLYERVCFETGEWCGELVEAQSPVP